MSQIVSVLLNGLVLGLILVLMATGLTITFGMLDVINFAHGSLYMLGAFITLFVVTSLGGELSAFLIAIALSAVALFALGGVMHTLLDRPELILFAIAGVSGLYAWTIFGSLVGVGVAVLAGAVFAFVIRYRDVHARSLYDRGHLPQIMVTFGFALLIDGAMEMAAGPSYRSMTPPTFLRGSTELLGVTYPTYRLFVVVATFSCLGLVGAFLKYTAYGQIIRAGVSEPEMVRLLGIDLNHAFIVVFGLGAALAGISGALIAPLRSVYPLMGIPVLIQSFAVIIIGGLGKFRNTLYAGILVGVVTSVMGTYYPSASEIIVYVVMAILLLVRPQGLFARTEAGV